MTIDKAWKILDLSKLNRASKQYRKAKSAYKTARSEPTLEHYNEAKKQYEEFTKLCTIDTVACTEYAEILEFLKKPDESIKQLERALELTGKRPKFLITDQSFLHLKLFEAYTEYNKYDKAIDIFNKIKPEKHELIGPLIDRIANIGEAYNKQIKKILEEKESKYKIKSDSIEKFDKRSLSYAIKENHDAHKTKLLIFLKHFETASYASIRSKVTKNKSTTDKILKELISEEVIEYKHIFNNDIFSITKIGKEYASKINEELKNNMKDIEKTKYIAYYFEPEDLREFMLNLEKLEEKEKMKKKEMMETLGLESEVIAKNKEKIRS